TSYGKTIAIDAGSGAVLWTFTPSGYSSWAGSYRITNSSPVADPSRLYVYSAAPDGKIHKLAISNGDDVGSGGWPVSITMNPGRGLAVQSGKDGKLRLLALRRLSGKRGRTGGELQTVSTPGGQGLFSAPAVWRHRVYVATGDGVWCYALVRGRLKIAWKRGSAGTSP